VDTIEVQLPSGRRCGETWCRDAVLRPLCGRDELFLVETGRTLGPAARVTALLGRCLARLGPCTPVPLDWVRCLTIGDREALLLHLHRVALGDAVSFVLTCPQAGCGARLDLDLDIAELLVPPYAEPAESYEAVCGVGDGSCRVRFRLPNGADQELAAPLARVDPAAAGALILKRCVQGGTAALSPSAAAELPARMAALDPQAEIFIDLTCPQCGGVFRRPFDAAACLFDDLSAAARDLHEQVHLIAFHYHWSEAAILAMGPARRQRYLDALRASLVQRRYDG
jgi:hypothetical protein